MALNIVWSKKADEKFDEIIEYLTTKWGDKTTKQFVKKVYNFLEVLSEFPEIGTVENKEKGIRGFPVVKQINLFYKITENNIILLDFFDNRQNPLNKVF